MGNSSVGIDVPASYRNAHDQARRLRNSSSVRSRNRSHVREIKLRRGCMDCGYNEHPAALDYDHRPGTSKCFNLGSTVTWSIARIDEEIAKCDVVCANCHRIRTFNRREETDE